ncbi:NADP-dependent oxidoreductase [Streptomyces chumphonensis]|uniref:NADP-dependent oxidoreductase n=1 Tax=Streptomyces chumphonensis TaxID=1214925 RepID=A0A927F086_9ACTN|nr:NADP-dependent oxidoreductase [Streptomyces chumphonensis]MBD3933003.1 NADP-dependent oxidoreductase [Streptomyces chumphonensis]
MRAALVSSFGGPEQVEIADVPVPAPGPGQVRVKVAAAALNPVDAAVRSGLFGGDGRRLGLGWDVAGTVDAVGDGAGFTVGEEVVGLAHGPHKALGSHADHVVLDASALAPAPASTDAVHAATLPLNGLTAAQALDLLALRAGQNLLVTGAAGALGGYAIQLAVRHGLNVTALAGTGDEELVRSLGAHRFVPRTATSLPHGFDGVLDAAVLGAPALALVRDGGAYTGVRPPAQPPAERGVRTATVGVRADGARLATLATLVDLGALTPRVAHTYPLADAADAHARHAKGGLRGRIVLVP